MDVQTLFYGLGSAFMILGIVLLLMMIIVCIIIWRKVVHIHTIITEKIDELNDIKGHPVRWLAEVAQSILKHKIRNA